MENLDPYHDVFIPVYIIKTAGHAKDMAAIEREYVGKKEFEVTNIRAFDHPMVPVGVWKSIRKVIEIAEEKEDDVVIISKDDHCFTEKYTKELLFKTIFEAAGYGTNLLVGGASGFGQAIPISENLFWIDSFSNARFMIIYRNFFQRILDETFELHDTIDGKLSELTSHKMLISPFISVQRNLSDHQFTFSALRLEMIRQAGLKHNESCKNSKGRLKSAMVNYNEKTNIYTDPPEDIIRRRIRFEKIPRTVKPLSESKIVVLIPFYNARDYIMECYQSVIEQDYQNFEVLFIDDFSSDGCIDLVPDGNRVFKVKKERRSLALANLYSALTTHSFDDNDIVIIVDGDDFLWHNQVFAELNEIYNKRDCLVTYGQYQTLYGRKGHCTPYTENEYQRLRTLDWRASHLKTFKYKLYREFLNVDPNGNSYKDDQGCFYEMTYDVALMTPLLEIAGYENMYFNDRPWYIYREHEKNDMAINAFLQHRIAKEIQEKMPFENLYLYKRKVRG